MESRSLGGQGLAASALGFGCMGLNWAYAGGGDATEAEATLIDAVDAGVTLFDTAEVYGPFENEKLVGRVLGGARRDRVLIATKFGFRIEGGGMARGVDSRPAHIREVVDGSLKRLATDRIDLLYQHRVDPSVPIEDVVGTMGEFVRAGKVRYLGLSEAIQWEASRFERRTGIRCRVASARATDLPNRDRALALFRIVQEALTNVAKHAEATRVSIVVTRRESSVTAVIEDDGQGFGAGGGSGDGLGLVGMKERVGLLGGRLALESTEGAGTTVVAEVPVA